MIGSRRRPSHALSARGRYVIPLLCVIAFAGVFGTYAILIGVGAAQGAPQPSSEKPGPVAGEACARTTLVVARGTGEGADPQGGILNDPISAVAGRPAEKPELQVRWIDYPADFWTYPISEREGTDRTKSIIAEYSKSCPNTRFILAGFSQGAAVMGDVAHDIGTLEPSMLSPEQVVGVFLVADPRRDPSFRPTLGIQGGGDGLMKPARTFGALNSRTTEYCTPHDEVCDAGRNVASAAWRGAWEKFRSPGIHILGYHKPVPAAKDSRDTYLEHFVQDVRWAVNHNPFPLAKYVRPTTPPMLPALQKAVAAARPGGGASGPR